MAGINFIQISFDGIKKEVEFYLQKLYNKSGILFSPASPYGQVLFVVQNLFMTSMLYIKNSISQFDMSNTSSNNVKIVRSNAIVAGHIPSRSVSATGTLKFKLVSSVDTEKDIPGGKITIFNKTQIKNKTNGLDYIIDLGGSDKVSYQITPNFQFFVNIIQGRWEFTDTTGKGESLQTFSVNVPGLKEVENFNVYVTVNGEVWTNKKHLYEMIPDEKACVVRTGYNGGLDVIFGNESFGKIPEIGSAIRVYYILTDGARGSIFRRTNNDFRFVSDVIDGFGQTIDLTQLFGITIATDINFGADGESVEFTRAIMPIASTNYVLALPQQYAYYIKRLGVFSHVNAYEKFGTIIIVCTPNIKLFKNQNKDYFTVNIAAFVLDSYEKSKIDKYLKTSGTIQLSRRYKIDSPTLSYYIMNVFVITYSDAVIENVQTEIYDKISGYFLNFNRTDRVPKKDLINLLSEIVDIDSVDISFVCKKDEDYHKSFFIQKSNVRTNVNNLAVRSLSRRNLDIFSTDDLPAYDANKSDGIDPILGDIIFEPNEIPIIRGGWNDRNSIFYSDNLNTNGFSSVNIIKRGVTERKNITNLS